MAMDKALLASYPVCEQILLAGLYECKGRAVALPLVSTWVAAMAAAGWTKCLSFLFKFLCDGQSACQQANLYVNNFV